MVIFGLVSLASFVLISFLLFIVCFIFSRILFRISKISLFIRLLFGGGIWVLFLELITLIIVKVPIALNLKVNLSDVAFHWNNVELSFSNLAYPLLPFVYLLFVFLGVVAFSVEAFSLERRVLWIKLQIKSVRLGSRFIFPILFPY